jgi:hypothetical protein
MVKKFDNQNQPRDHGTGYESTTSGSWVRIKNIKSKPHQIICHIQFIYKLAKKVSITTEYYTMCTDCYCQS